MLKLCSQALKERSPRHPWKGAFAKRQAFHTLGRGSHERRSGHRPVLEFMALMNMRRCPTSPFRASLFCHDARAELVRITFGAHGVT